MTHIYIKTSGSKVIWEGLIHEIPRVGEVVVNPHGSFIVEHVYWDFEAVPPRAHIIVK